MVGTVLTCLSFLGFVHAAHSRLRIKLSYSPLFSISFLGVCLYLFATAGYLRVGAQILLAAGAVFFILFLIESWRKKNNTDGMPFDRSMWIFVALLFISFLLAVKMAFTVIDDYVYWGIIGKYLYLHDHLPVSGNPLDKRILAYTPGTALIHYFFYILPGKYSSDTSYFAQNVILSSALFVLTDRVNMKKAIVLVCVQILLLTLFYGSVFNKLQVDYLLAVISFSLFWIYISEADLYRKLITVSMPLLFLFLVKQVGFALSIVALLMIFIDLFFNSFENKKEKIKAVLIVLTIGIGVVILQQIWAHRIQVLGFAEFHNAINPGTIKKALNIFGDAQVRKGFAIFVKEVLLGPADRMNLPYLFWYAILVFLGYKIKGHFPADSRKRRTVFFSSLCMILIIYLFSLYLLQIIIFNVGGSSDHAIGFARYFNIFFLPVVMICVLTALHQIRLKDRPVNVKVCTVFCILIITVLFASRVEVFLHREKQDVEVEMISHKIKNHIELKEGVLIGIITSKFDGLANLQFLYHLLPDTVDYNVSRFRDIEKMVQYIQKHDYVIVYYPGPGLSGWIGSLTNGNAEFPKISLLKVSQVNPEDQEPVYAYERLLL